MFVCQWQRLHAMNETLGVIVENHTGIEYALRVKAALMRSSKPMLSYPIRPRQMEPYCARCRVRLSENRRNGQRQTPQSASSDCGICRYRLACQILRQYEMVITLQARGHIYMHRRSHSLLSSWQGNGSFRQIVNMECDIFNQGRSSQRASAADCREDTRTHLPPGRNFCGVGRKNV